MTPETPQDARKEQHWHENGHDFVQNDPRWPSLMRNYAACLRCGVVRRADGNNKPCSGVMPKITLRRTDSEGRR